ncbi:TetR/AcrR family transcriptional regulator C-terminal domain-containing protein [Streptomyces violascens]|uniref:TetR/AcrR family transcriptional regulator C-terminal domain-containing protein n=1 Tax=Streptomyces violascens TaxID=67381 RepID=UPI003685EF79
MEPHATAPLPSPEDDWRDWFADSTRSFRRTLLMRRDGARLHAGSTPTGRPRPDPPQDGLPHRLRRPRTGRPDGDAGRRPSDPSAASWKSRQTPTPKTARRNPPKSNRPWSSVRSASCPAPGALAVGTEYTYPFRRVTVPNRAVGRVGFVGCVRCPSPVVVAVVTWRGGACRDDLLAPPAARRWPTGSNGRDHRAR